jgi:thiol-disulfide isomerase/thioredoxin
MNKIYIIITAIVLTFSACSNDEINESIFAEEKVFVSEEFNLTTLENKIITLSSTTIGLDFKEYKGKKVVLINAFATWCPPCIKEIPMLEELRKEYGDDFEIISVLFEKEKSVQEIQDFKHKHNITYPITLGNENYKLFSHLDDVQKVPEMFLYNKNGVYIKKFVGETTKKDLENSIQFALKTK